MSPDSSTTPRTDGDGTGTVPAKAAASLRGRAVLVVGCRGRMGAMLCRRGKAAGLDMRGVDVPLTDAVLAPACKPCVSAPCPYRILCRNFSRLPLREVCPVYGWG